MNKTAQHSTPAWLLRGIHSIPGRLTLAGGRLSFTAFGAGNCGRRQLRRLESATGQEGLAKRLSRNEEAVVFEVPLSDVQEVTFPWYYFSGGLKLTVRGVRYRFGFDRPANTKLSGEGGDVVGESTRARRRGKAWKTVFSDLRGSALTSTQTP